MNIKIVLFLTTFLFLIDTMAQKIHVVEPKESLFGIARTYNIAFKKLVEANKIDTPYLIRIGDTLQIPLSQKKNIESLDEYEYHVVAPQQTVYSILKLYPNLDKRDFYTWNEIDSNSNNIQIGQRLKIKKNEHKTSLSQVHQKLNTHQSINTKALFEGEKNLISYTPPAIKTKLTNKIKETEHKSIEKQPEKNVEKFSDNSAESLKKQFESSLKKTRKYCTAKIIENDAKNSCIFADANEGEVVKITNTKTKKWVLAKVLSKMQLNKNAPNECIIFSSYLANRLGLDTIGAFVLIEY